MSMFIRKTMLISKFKFLKILRTPQLFSSSILSILFCTLMAEYAPKEQLAVQPLFIITTGLIFSMAMGGVMLTALPLAADKENDTLRVLMVSTISPSNYLLGSLLPPIFVVLATNILIGVFWLPKEIPFFTFFTISSIGTLISLTIGLIVGFYSSSQMKASSTCFPIVFVFALIPIFRTMSSDFEKYSNYLYTSQVLNYLTNVYENTSNPLTSEVVTTLAITLISAIFISIYGYRKNRFDS